MEWLHSKRPIAYEKAIDLMTKRAKNLKEKTTDELIWFLEHENVYTYGSLAKPEDVIEDVKGVQLYKTNRGGKYTYHGLGQRVIYAIIDIGARNLGVKEYVLSLEHWCIAALKEFDILGFVVPNKAGVWSKNINGETIKIASIGLNISKGIATHGIAINVVTDLSFFEKIVPCGINDCKMGSVQLLKKNINLELFDIALLKNVPEFLV